MLHLSRANTAAAYGTGGSINNNWIEALGPNHPSVFADVHYAPTPAGVGTVTLTGTSNGHPWSITAAYDLPNVNTTAQVTFQLASPGQALALQTGPANATADHMGISLPSLTSTSLELSAVSFTAPGGPTLAQTLIRNALSTLTTAQSHVGAALDQLNAAGSNVDTERLNGQATQATIADTNVATASTQMSREQLLAQTGVQALMTADRLPKAVLSLLG